MLLKMYRVAVPYVGSTRCRYPLPVPALGISVTNQMLFKKNQIFPRVLNESRKCLDEHLLVDAMAIANDNARKQPLYLKMIKLDFGIIDLFQFAQMVVA